MSDRFHRAARDGYLDLLQQATRKDCNAHDEDGMTPTILAADCGKLEALRMLTGRGGDPNKCDFFGTTALHASAAHGHFNCVSFLVNFGVNLWALDNSQATAKDVAAQMNHDDVLRFLDVEMTRQARLNAKSTQKLKERSMHDYEERLKKAEKRHLKAIEKAKIEEKKMLNKRINVNAGEQISPGNSGGSNPGNGVAFSAYTKGPAKNNNNLTSAVGAKVSRARKLLNSGGSVSSHTSDFRVGEMDSSGKRSVRSISGVQSRRGTGEVLLVPKFDTQGSAGNGPDQRTHIQDIFGGSIKAGRLNRTASEPYINFMPIGGEASDTVNGGSGMQPSLFERRGFGTVVLGQGSLSGTMLAMTAEFADGQHRRHHDEDGDSGGSSIGSAGSLARRTGGWLPYGLEDEQLTGDDAALETFLTAHGLRSCLHWLRLERVDLRALFLLNETELKELGLPLGERKKLMDAIERRKMALNDAGDVYDSRL